MVRKLRIIYTSLAITALAYPMVGVATRTSAHRASSASHATARSSSNTYYWISQDSTLPLFVAHDQVALKIVAKQLGISIRIAGPTNIDLPGFISTINQVCALHPAGVSVVGWDPSETAAVNQCIAEGVPTVTDDADLPASKRLTFIGTNWYQIGVTQAQQMIQALGGKGEVALLSIINADNMKQAVAGFTATIAGTGIKIVASQDDGGDATQSASRTAALLAAHPNLAGIAGFDAESGTGIVRALTEGGKLGKVKVTTMEQTPAFFNNVKTGVVQAVIVQKRELFTYYAFKMLYDYNHSGMVIDGLGKQYTSPIPQNIDTGLLVVNKSDIDQFLAHMSH
ncbi:MAG TPA: substrate-binding domain-containing protein [Chloroflexota bacterium]|jgi:ABC-type sugar transport system substrate-binding protein